MAAHTRVDGGFKEVSTLSTKVAGVWKEIDSGHIKVAGQWQEFFSSAQPYVIENVEWLVQAGGQAGTDGTSGNGGGRNQHTGASTPLTFAQGDSVSIIVGASNSASQIIKNSVTAVSASTAGVTIDTLNVTINGTLTTYTKAAVTDLAANFTYSGLNNSAIIAGRRRCFSASRTLTRTNYFRVRGGASVAGATAQVGLFYASPSLSSCGSILGCGNASRGVALGVANTLNLGNTFTIGGSSFSTSRGSGGYGQQFASWQSACTNSTVLISGSTGSSNFVATTGAANSGNGGGGNPGIGGAAGGSGFVELRYSIEFPPLASHGTAEYRTDATYRMYTFNSTTNVTV